MAKKQTENKDTVKGGALTGTAPGANYRFTLRGWWPAAALCLATAGLLALAFPPLRWAWLAHVALVPLLLAVVRAANKKTRRLRRRWAGRHFSGSRRIGSGTLTSAGLSG
jgi:hypothetical protein